jgi:mRNA interferase RelE/StbE
MRRRALEAADNLAIDPRPPGCRKLEGGEDAYRIRFGDYRIVYTIDDGVKIVSITYVRHRREVYR